MAKEANNTQANETKQPRVTLMSQARDMFATQLGKWVAGDFKGERRPYTTFRQTLINQFKDELNVTTPSAATMFNNLKNQALNDNPDLVLQRDPKIARVKSTRGPGRPRNDEKAEDKAEQTETA